MRTLILLLLSSSQLTAATWFVDSTASGANNGTSWANAWQTIAAIGSTPAAGDTVYISGGATGTNQTYNSGTWAPKGGTLGNVVTYQIGQDSLHNGVAIFNRTSGTIFINQSSHFKVSGDAGNNKCHFRTKGWGQLGYEDSQTEVEFDFIECDDSAFGDAVEGQNVTMIIVNSCILSNALASSDHLFNTGFGGHNWDENVMESNLLYCPQITSSPNIGADFWNIGGSGTTWKYNTLIGYNNSSYSTGQHQDGIQFIGAQDHLKFIGNRFINIKNFSIFGDAVQGHQTNILVLNNIFQSSAGAVFGTDGSYFGPLPNIFSDIIIAGNTFDCPDNGGQPLSLNNVTGFSTTFLRDVVADNVIIAGGGTSFTGNTTSTITNNPAMTAVQAATNFVSYISAGNTNNNLNLHIRSSLITAGTNLSTYFNTDYAGNARPATGAWDIGAYQYQSGIVTYPQQNGFQIPFN